MKKEKSCGAVISRLKNNQRQILLIKHKNGGHWAFPKGHMEENETEEETAAREILEETGLNATIDTSFRETVTYSPKKDIQKDVVYFSATVTAAVPVAQLTEVEKICWLSPTQAMERINFENDRHVLRQYMVHITK